MNKGIVIEGIIKSNTNIGGDNEGLWGIKTQTGFVECGNLLGELDIFLSNNKKEETKEGSKIKIVIE